jgi:hypothetical protein
MDVHMRATTVNAKIVRHRSQEVERAGRDGNKRIDGDAVHVRINQTRHYGEQRAVHQIPKSQ